MWLIQIDYLIEWQNKANFHESKHLKARTRSLHKLRMNKSIQKHFFGSYTIKSTSTYRKCSDEGQLFGGWSPKSINLLYTNITMSWLREVLSESPLIRVGRRTQAQVLLEKLAEFVHFPLPSEFLAHLLPHGLESIIIGWHRYIALAGAVFKHKGVIHLVVAHLQVFFFKAERQKDSNG